MKFLFFVCVSFISESWGSRASRAWHGAQCIVPVDKQVRLTFLCHCVRIVGVISPEFVPFLYGCLEVISHCSSSSWYGVPVACRLSLCRALRTTSESHTPPWHSSPLWSRELTYSIATRCDLIRCQRLVLNFEFYFWILFASIFHLFFLLGLTP